jgi:hypothetical protein
MHVWRPEDETCDHAWTAGDEAGIGTRIQACWRCRAVRPADPERDEVSVGHLPWGEAIVLVSPKGL